MTKWWDKNNDSNNNSSSNSSNTNNNNTTHTTTTTMPCSLPFCTFYVFRNDFLLHFGDFIHALRILLLFLARFDEKLSAEKIKHTLVHVRAQTQAQAHMNIDIGCVKNTRANQYKQL